jgi:hypothetical protein
VFDVFSMNIYGFEPPREKTLEIAKIVQRPILFTEFHAGVAERGYAAALVMVKDQTERGVAYQYYVERSAALAPVIGTHHFAWVDEPVLGRGDGENYNFGFVDQTDQPYAELLAFAKKTHHRVYQVHAGQLPPESRVPKIR